MSIGTITWKIEKGLIGSTTISDVKQNGLGIGSGFHKLESIFKDLRILGVDNLEVTARIHIQDGKDFFQLRDIGAEGGVNLSSPFSFCQEELFFASGKELQPILHISKWGLTGDGNHGVFFPRYASVMDSSVWNYYLCISDDKNTLATHAAWIVTNIAQNVQDGVYKLVISKEYADLNARLVCDSYIASESKGHGSDISPFLFHSEWEMGKKFEPIVEEVKKYSWRFLLVDDYAWRSMEKGQAPNNSVLKVPIDSELKVFKNSKLDILSRTISSMGLDVRLVIKSGQRIVNKDGEDYTFDTQKDEALKPNPIVEIWGVDSISEAFDALSAHNRKYDIILLDYLLGKHSIEDSFGEEKGYYFTGREYGYQLLKRLKEVDKYKVIEGPVGQQFFMFISAFTTAVGERLRAEGLHRSEDKWYIAEGACPTNTPNLFRYYLARVMEHRLKQTNIDGLSYEGILNSLNSIFIDRNDTNDRSSRIQTVRGEALKKYKEILGLHYDYFVLKEDENKSLLVNSFLKEKDHMDALLEHLLQFIHLVAFGTVRQWPDIWEEYQFVIRTLNISPQETDKMELVRKVSRLIEKHIIDLKSA